MKTILTAMSGGIDSSMTALLLQEKGYKVIGVTMAVWDESYNRNPDAFSNSDKWKGGCFGPSEYEDIESAKEICAKLGIDHHTIDLSKEYEKIVLDYFRSNYLSGTTPNPCIICNRNMKFTLIPQVMKEKGVHFDLYATGHYAILKKQQPPYHNDTREYVYIARAKDETKDQSYFLCMLQQEQLSNLIFPLGEYSKEEIRKMAIAKGLVSLAEKKESQDFIDCSDYDLLFKEHEPQPGLILDKDGNTLGQHKGIIYYTVGKRRGMNVAGLKEPYYVTAIDAAKNVIYAGPKSELYRNELTAVDVVWADNLVRTEEFKLSARIRLRHQEASCSVIYQGSNKYLVRFDEPQMSVTPGQIIAFYDNDVVLGGGKITL